MFVLISTIFLLLAGAILFSVICVAIGKLFAQLLRPFWGRHD